MHKERKVFGIVWYNEFLCENLWYLWTKNFTFHCVLRGEK